jgi:hypothetical protein
MANCDKEKLVIAALEEAIADSSPSPDASPSEQARAQRVLATLRLALQHAREDLRQCENRHLWLEARIQVVRMADSDGRNETPLTAAQAQQWVDSANRVFAPARVRFAYDQAVNFETRRNTRLNEVWVDSGLQVDALAVEDATTIGKELQDRIVVIARRSRTISPTPQGGCGPGQGCSWWTGNHIIMPSFDPNWIDGFSHEFGHYLGLPHTFWDGWIDTTNDAQVIFDLLNKDPQALDNDVQFVSDTPPEIMIRDRDNTTDSVVTLRGVAIHLLRDNIMSYYQPLTANTKTITQGQAHRVRQILDTRRDAGLRINEFTP